MLALLKTLALALAVAFAAGAQANSLKVYVFIHDDVPEPIAASPQEYFDPWLDEMHKIQPYPVEIDYRRSVPGITDVPYQAPDEARAIRQFRQAVGGTDDATFSTRDHNGAKLYLLFTGDDINDRLRGVAEIGGAYGIASTSAYAAPGHELGHMLTATHEASQVLNNPWFCETYMIPERVSLRSNCYRYSDQNRAIIGDHIHKRF
ncbi:hypothetical protein [Pseudomonas sp. KNUC1026]|uniref:hypothetical protein n=1 Tax=Pseudomonas sp. KNUC1026 TaxID=2893890 RepID=UPI001F35AB55|nr:hypothetical protein [Pseudomonas sp. KNUC1026]UFH49317.1 hypothetical protein LN139_21040 [Pseudomonas sp. KNUC1026]